MDEDGKVAHTVHYYPFGEEFGSDEDADSAAQPYRFNAKEDQSFTGVPLLDYGARFYNPALARWTTPDPLAEKYYSISPYAFCNNNPVRYVDPDGMNPIYNSSGVFLGTDDTGLQGHALFMDASVFKQGMSQEDALSNDQGIDYLEDSDAIKLYENNYNSLADRPDWDGYLTLEEANEWYRNGNGEPLFVDINKIDLSSIDISDHQDVGKIQVVNTLFGSIKDWSVYGKITVKTYPNHSVRAFSDNYGFEMKKPLIRYACRNIETVIGKIVAGKGTPYEINIYGTKHLK